MRRKLFNFAAAVSLLLFLAAAAMCVRSYSRTDGFSFWTASGLLELKTQKGKLFLDNDPQRALDQRPMETVSKRYWSINAGLEPLNRDLEEASSTWQKNPDRFNKGAARGAAKHIVELRMKLAEQAQELPFLQDRMLRWVRRPLPVAPPLSHSVPLYLPVILAAALPGIWIVSALLGSRRNHRRQRMNQCLACDYNLTGNISGVCPECGTPILRSETIMAK